MKLLVTILLVLLMAGPVPAIIVADYAVATNPPSGSWDVNWSFVYNYKTSSGVAVGSRWLLTAAHVADDSFSGTLTINGITYSQQEIIFHHPDDDPAHTNKADLALVRFDKEFPGYYPLYTGDFLEWTWVGFGRFGSWQSSPATCVMAGYGVTGAVFSAYYTMSTSGKGTRRWGSNKIDGAVTVTQDVEGVTGVTVSEGRQILFTSTSTSYEAGVGTGDSGGGTFIKTNGVWKLAGINTLVYGNGTDGQYVGNLTVSVPAYYAWATNVMDPAGDLDGDGLPNYWEQQYGTTTGLAASADSDSDGFSNLQEFTADTNPTNPASFFEMSGFMAAEVQTIYFTGSTARQYQVFFTTNDLSSTNLNWIAAHTNKIRGAGTNSSVTVTNTDEKAFYRLRVSWP